MTKSRLSYTQYSDSPAYIYMYTCSTLNIRALYSYYINVKYTQNMYHYMYMLSNEAYATMHLMLSYADGLLVGDYLCLGTRV